MSKLNVLNRIQRDYDQKMMTDLILAIQNKLNNLSEGRISSKHNSSSVIPNASSYPNAVPGDVVANLGASSGGYVGWVYLVSGSWTTYGAIS